MIHYYLFIKFFENGKWEMVTGMEWKREWEMVKWNGKWNGKW
jgi:hypothetical protein